MQRAAPASSPRVAVASWARRPYLAASIMNQASDIIVTINGEPRRVAAGASIAAMVRSLSLDPAKVAVERNREIVPRSTLGEVTVADGDQFEIVHFVGGG